MRDFSSESPRHFEKKDDVGMKSNEFMDRSSEPSDSSWQRTRKKSKVKKGMVVDVVRPRPDSERLATLPEVGELHFTPLQRHGLLLVVFHFMQLDDEDVTKTVFERLDMVSISSP